MKSIVKPSGVSGIILAPASKSVAQRAIALAAMANGKSTLSHVGNCDDVKAAIAVCRQLGANIIEKEDKLIVEGGIHTPSEALHCGESGLGIRMFCGVAATLSEKITLTGGGSLVQRPMQMEGVYERLGVSVSTNNGLLPIEVKGPIQGGHTQVDGTLGSQILTGLLMASPVASKNTSIEVHNLQSKRYIDITIDTMKEFGVQVENHNYERFTIEPNQSYKATDYTVEGDWSGAAFLLVAGAIAGKVKVENLLANSSQPDKAILEALFQTGALISIKEEEIEVHHNQLQPFHFDATHCPDLFPPLVALAAHCKGESRILGVSRLRAKESDRAKTLQEEFGKMGVKIEINGELMHVYGSSVKGATVHSHGDHRIAMACAIAGLKATGEVIIENSESVAKSYTNFFDDLKSICKTP